MTWRFWRGSIHVWLQSTAVPTVGHRSHFWVWLSSDFLHFPTWVSLPPCSRASPPGQSSQTAVLWRRTDPEDSHAGGEGERKRSLLSLECFWTDDVMTVLFSVGHHLRHWRSWHQSRRLHGRHAQGQVWRRSCRRLLPGKHNYAEQENIICKIPVFV